MEKSQASHLCQQALASIPFLGKNFFQLFLRWSQIFILSCLYYISFLLEFVSSYFLHWNQVSCQVHPHSYKQN